MYIRMFQSDINLMIFQEAIQQDHNILGCYSSWNYATVDPHEWYQQFPPPQNFRSANLHCTKRALREKSVGIL